MADPGLVEEYRLLTGSVGAVWLDRAVVSVDGPDATTYLQGQLSQDLLGVAEGGSTWSWILAPAGKVDALIRVTRSGPDGWLLDTEAGWGDVLLARLRRFKLRTKADIEPLDWRFLGLRGPSAQAPASPEPGTRVLDAGWPGVPGLDLVGPDPAVPEGVPVVGTGAWDVVRIEAGIPRMGAEISERTIPAEIGLIDRTVSFTKGCYTGQELVARIDSRGSNVPRHLRVVTVDAPEDAALGSDIELEADGRGAGRLTSTAWSPARGWVALGLVGRAVAPGDTVVVGPDRWPGVVAEPPLVPPGS